MTISKNEEFQYLNLIETVISTGEERNDRTGTGTISIFAPSPMRFSLLKFPLLTTKKMHLRGIFEELKWFIRGSTNSFELSNLNVNIWNKNQLDVQERLDYEPGDLGPIYGFQWRHFGAEYLGLNHDYTGKGKDQLFQVFEQLIYNPNSRRIIISAWNPYELDQMALPPCHIFCQFYVKNKNGKKYLSSQMYQRSCDMGLGVPYNIASYSLFTLMIAKVLGYEPGEFIHCMGDCHVYLDHVEALKGQLRREPFEFPTLDINLETVVVNERKPSDVINECIKKLENIQFKDLKLNGYQCHEKIQMSMSV